MKEVSQNAAGNKFACPYFDDGRFKLRVCGEKQRPHAEALKADVDFNRELNLNNHTMVNEDFFDPYMNAVFIGEEQLYVCLFHNGEMCHYHFLWDVEYRQILNI
jgi:hypothetical protein